MNVIANIVVTPDGTILQSFHRHDYKIHSDKNGNMYMVDGGVDYFRRSNNGDEKCYQVTDESDFNEIRECYMWGSYGKDGKGILKTLPLSQLETDHIKAIIKTQKHLPKWSVDIFKKELKFRDK